MLDARKEWDLAPVREFLHRTEPVPPEEARTYALRLSETVLEHREELDTWLDQVHPGWRLERMGAEDRNILRLGLAELRYHPDVPPKVVLNEWVEIAKVFGGDDTPRFVNGILDRAWKDATEGDGSDADR